MRNILILTAVATTLAVSGASAASLNVYSSEQNEAPVYNTEAAYGVSTETTASVGARNVTAGFSAAQGFAVSDSNDRTAPSFVIER